MTEEAKKVDLNGEFRFKTDSKGRMSLPSKFRKVLSNELVVTIDPQSGDCVKVFESDTFNDWVDQLFIDRFGGFVSSDKMHIALRRKLKAHAFDVQVDAAGRIMIPADMRTACGIDRDVVIVGNTGYFEVWDAGRYVEADEQVDLSLLFN